MGVSTQQIVCNDVSLTTDHARSKNIHPNANSRLRWGRRVSILIASEGSVSGVLDERRSPIRRQKSPRDTPPTLGIQRR
jgi:hypothetical protein